MHRAHMAIDKTKRQLLAHPEYGKLITSVENDEIEKLKAMNVYIERHRSQIRKDALIIGSRFVHTVDESDKKSNGNVKARCVAQGYKQPIGPEETYSPVISPESLRAFVMAAVSGERKVRQMDVSSAYLHADLDKPVSLYIRLPKGLAGIEEDAVGFSLVCKA